MLRICFFVFVWTTAAAEVVDFPFQSAEQERRFRDLAEELRCLVCQNQSLADSNAALAGDLRSELYRQVLDDQPDDRIVAFMTQRYGEFILYRPRLNAGTLLLWVAPLLLFVAAGFVLFRFSRRREELPAGATMGPERRKMRDLLEDGSREK